MTREIIMELLQAVVMLAVVLATRYLVPYIIERIGSERLATAAKLAEQAVLYAEQLHGAGTGYEKKQMVVRLLKRLLEDRGIQVSTEELDMLIEAAVRAMNAGKLEVSELKEAGGETE